MHETLTVWAPPRIECAPHIHRTALASTRHSKILGFPAVRALPTSRINSLTGASGLIELIGGALFTIGLFTRPVAFILSGFAAVAYFRVSCT